MRTCAPRALRGTRRISEHVGLAPSTPPLLASRWQLLMLVLLLVMGMRVRESQARYTSSGQPALVFTFFREYETTKEVEP